MWTLICLTPAALLLAHQIRKAAQAPKQQQPTLADIPVIVLVGTDLEAEL
jgi:hypothetical protein